MALWRAEHETHHAHVQAELPPERPLASDIKADPQRRLCDFIGVPRECVRFRRRESPSPGR